MERLKQLALACLNRSLLYLPSKLTELSVQTCVQKKSYYIVWKVKDKKQKSLTKTGK